MSQTTPQKEYNRCAYSAPPLSPNRNRLISKFLFQSTPEKENDRMDCAICLCTLKGADIDNITETKCTHFFHKSCLDEMKSKLKSQCPICRGPLTPPSNPSRTPTDQTTPTPMDSFYHQQLSSHALNPHHSSTQTNIVNAARRGREAVRQANARRERERLTAMQSTEISSY